MANLDGEKLRGLVRGLVCGDQDATSKTRADNFSVARSLRFTAPTTVANTNLALSCIVPATDRPIRVTAVKANASAAQASAAADGWTFAVKYDDGAGGTSTNVATFATTAAAIVANNVFSFTVAAPVDIAAGKRLFLVGTAVNTAVAANAMVLTLNINHDET